ncbi:hypothetical protein BsWGS_07689 [Bradybaena similaris]
METNDSGSQASYPITWKIVSYTPSITSHITGNGDSDIQVSHLRSWEIITVVLFCKRPACGLNTRPRYASPGTYPFGHNADTIKKNKNYYFILMLTHPLNDFMSAFC